MGITLAAAEDRLARKVDAERAAHGGGWGVDAGRWGLSGHRVRRALLAQVSSEVPWRLGQAHSVSVEYIRL